MRVLGRRWGPSLDRNLSALWAQNEPLSLSGGMAEAEAAELSGDRAVSLLREPQAPWGAVLWGARGRLGLGPALWSWRALCAGRHPGFRPGVESLQIRTGSGIRLFCLFARLWWLSCVFLRGLTTVPEDALRQCH